MEHHCGTNGANSIIYRMALAGCTYQVSQEPNQVIFQGKKRTLSTIVRLIIQGSKGVRMLLSKPHRYEPYTECDRCPIIGLIPLISTPWIHKIRIVILLPKLEIRWVTNQLITILPNMPSPSTIITMRVPVLLQLRMSISSGHQGCNLHIRYRSKEYVPYFFDFPAQSKIE
ncbi:hypothetical protein H5410_023378 [Solanum commersonii]|uniref:Uncharacterized protein n=1 Tax=Solanum commersonii TaxID=4109 RepID=A0A9J5ZGP6_SOLCO|nr:hypothetical protein H5410_023378 [Solanum commersonii]